MDIYTLYWKPDRSTPSATMRYFESRSLETGRTRIVSPVYFNLVCQRSYSVEMYPSKEKKKKNHPPLNVVKLFRKQLENAWAESDCMKSGKLFLSIEAEKFEFYF